MGERTREKEVWCLEKETEGCRQEKEEERFMVVMKLANQRHEWKLMEKGSSSLLTLIGVLLIIAGVIVAYFTVTGPASQYGIGVIVAIILFALGFYILKKSGKWST